MDPPKFVISAGEAESLARLSNLTVSQLLPTLVKSAQLLARPPISNYPVAAAGLSSDGRIFLGVNLEFPNLPLHHSVHAEQFLIVNLIAHHSPRLLSFAVSAAPCGHCRQFLQELRHANHTQILITSENNPAYKPLSSFLPNPFGPCDLLDQEMPLLLEKHDNNLCLLLLSGDDKAATLCNGVKEYSTPFSEFPSNGVVIEEFVDTLRIEALNAANDSHAPYSGCPSGVALMDDRGKVYKGNYMESAAYNPSLGPVQAALVAFIASGGGGYEGIVAAVLVEKEGAQVRQEESVRLLLSRISPKCDFQVFHCCVAVNGCVKASTLCE